MRPQNLEEFAQELRRKGDFREADFAGEILALIDLEADVAEPYSEICDDLAHYAPGQGQPRSALEWIGDRSNLLEEIEKLLEDADRKDDVEDTVKELLDTMVEAEEILREHGWAEGDFLDALQRLADRAARAPEEMEIMTYDL